MGEAKRRKELGLPPKTKKYLESKNKKNIFLKSNFSINKLKSQFPAAPFVATALILVILQLGLSLNS